MSEIYKIIIKGNSPTQLHGVTLRDEICRMGNELKLKGKTKNIKGEAKVEVIFKVDNKKKPNYSKKK